MIIKASVRFFLRLRASTTADKPVRLTCRVILKGQKPFDIPTTSALLPSQFDAPSQQVIGSMRECDEARRTMGEWRTMITDILTRYELIEHRTPQADEVRLLILDTLGRLSIDKMCSHPIRETFNEYISETEKRNGIKDSTSIHLRTSINRLLSITGDIDVADVGVTHMERMNAQLIKRGLKNTTLQKNEQMLRQFFNWAIKKGYCQGEWLSDYRPRYRHTTGDKEIIYLTREELQQLEQADLATLVANATDEPECWAFSAGQLERCRDVFLFCCYTSLRYSDVASLKRTDIVGDIMHIVTQKTSDALHIDLNVHAHNILAKYSTYDLPNNHALPVVSAQVMNRMLKRMAKLVGLTRPIHRVYYIGRERIDEQIPLCDVISTHAGRRTFVVMALSLGIPAEVIMRWTGHSSFTAMRPYIAIVDELKKKEMRKFNLL